MNWDFSEKREHFVGMLRSYLGSRDMELVTAELGRKGELAVWVVTLYLPSRQVQTFHAEVLSGDALDSTLCMEIIDQLTDYLRPPRIRLKPAV